ncbi:hypothetical protein B0T16DRAFT_370876 [Cercophora newfieldiana]|uniref:Aflatoxin regulatory protein domain-containing protein n=1 Tax=Cercophora newfieldiana TaxID=92897 RepID=A0AA39Y9Z3_9PEZI|nr:hypothetical protein B0T16DRAFT_370876 [Cercophora newfieldiana]
MPTRTVYGDDDDLSFPPDLFSLLPTHHTADTDGLDLPDCDTAWVFDTDADPGQMQMQFSDFGSADHDMDLDITDIHDIADLQPQPQQQPPQHQALPDLPTGSYQPSNGSSSSSSSLSSMFAPVSRSMSNASIASALSPWSSLSPSPRFPAINAAANQCPSQTRCRSTGISETCLAAALRTLTSLHIAHSACLSAHRESPTTPQARKMETVLAMNKDVVAGMRPILACACSARSLVQLLLLSICGNLIAWNSAMIGADLEQHFSQNNKGSDSDPLSSACAPRARVLAQPITIGQHQINGKLGRALHAQVMAGELRILEGLIDALSHRFCEASRDACAPSVPQSKGLPNNVHRHIISSLRTRLQRTRAAIFSLG